MNDPFIQFVLSVYGIASSIWGLFMWEQLKGVRKPAGFQVFLFLFGGPCVWMIEFYRAAKRLRHKILSERGLPTCDCCH